MLRVLRERQHLGVDLTSLVEVQPAAGEVLQAQVAVAVDLRVLQPRLHVGRGTRIGRKQVHRGRHADVRERLPDRRVLRTLQPRLHLVEVDCCSVHLAEQHEVVPRAVVGVREDHPLRKGLEEGGDLTLDRLGVALVELHEERHDTARVQPALGELEKLARVEHRGTLDPRVERV